MRKLLWFAIGFAVSCLLCAYIFVQRFLLIFAGTLLVAYIAFLFIRTKNAKRVRVMLLGCVIAAVWFFCYRAYYLQPLLDLDGQKVTVSGEATDYGQDFENYTRCTCSIRLNGRRYQVSCFLYEVTDIQPGDRISGDFVLRYTADGGLHPSAYHAGEGEFAILHNAGNITVEKCDSLPAKYFPAFLRRWTENKICKLFPRDTAGFAVALILGNDDGLSLKDDYGLQISGIRHVISVSGLHVSILFALIYFLSGKNRIATAAFGIPLLILFAAVAGFSPSVTRATIMQILMILAMLFRREYDPGTALSFAVLLILAWNPIAATSAAFQLSVGSVAGIFLFASGIQRFLDSLYKGKREKAGYSFYRFFICSVSITLAALIVTLPICAIRFGYFSFASVLTNLLTVWIVPFLFYGIALSVIVSMPWSALGSAVALIVGYGIRYVLAVSGWISRFPFAAVFTNNHYTVIWLIFTYVLLIVYILSGKKKPLIPVSCILAGLLLSLTLTTIELNTDRYRVTVLDVGQGECVLLECGDESYLVDCGGDSAKQAAKDAANLLKSRGKDHLDGLILTHFDTDHALGSVYLNQLVEISSLYFPDAEDDCGIRDQLMSDFEGNIYTVRQSREILLSHGTITLFPGKSGSVGNESCTGVLFQPEDCAILITGDLNTTGEAALLDTGKIPKLNLLIAGHHGAANATGFELLRQTDPDIAVISVGAYNRFGHPSQEVLDRLALFGCRVWRTDRDQTVTFRGR